MKRVWITGASGHVGSALVELFDEMEYELFLTDKDVDVTEINDVLQFCHINRPDVIINCASLTGLVACENNKDEAYKVNAIGVRNIALAANEINAKVIQISTDDVFGVAGKAAYNEFDTPDPITIYGKSKYAGEKILSSLMNRFVIIRSSWVYGIGKDIVSTVLDAVKTGSDFYAAGDIYSSPTSASELARVIRYFVDRDEFGIYHAVCQGSCNRYEFVNAVLEYSGNAGKINVVLMDSDNEQVVTGAVLDNLMLRLTGLKQPKPWRDALKEYITGGNL
ncbi:MAG: SDR family oxidoreductase [Lachnospiraceae bacterium]